MGQESNEGGAAYAGYVGGGGQGRTPTSASGIDLSQFLPGGAKDPMRRPFAAGFSLHSAQINGRYVDIWNRISVRMQEKCKLRELIGCE